MISLKWPCVSETRLFAVANVLVFASIANDFFVTLPNLKDDTLPMTQEDEQRQPTPINVLVRNDSLTSY